MFFVLLILVIETAIHSTTTHDNFITATSDNLKDTVIDKKQTDKPKTPLTVDVQPDVTTAIFNIHEKFENQEQCKLDLSPKSINGYIGGMIAPLCDKCWTYLIGGLSPNVAYKYHLTCTISSDHTEYKEGDFKTNSVKYELEVNDIKIDKISVSVKSSARHNTKSENCEFHLTDGTYKNSIKNCEHATFDKLNPGQQYTITFTSNFAEKTSTLIVPTLMKTPEIKDIIQITNHEINVIWQLGQEFTAQSEIMMKVGKKTNSLFPTDKHDKINCRSAVSLEYFFTRFRTSHVVDNVLTNADYCVSVCSKRKVGYCDDDKHICNSCATQVYHAYSIDLYTPEPGKITRSNNTLAVSFKPLKTSASAISSCIVYVGLLLSKKHDKTLEIPESLFSKPNFIHNENVWYAAASFDAKHCVDIKDFILGTNTKQGDYVNEKIKLNVAVAVVLKVCSKSKCAISKPSNIVNNKVNVSINKKTILLSVLLTVGSMVIIATIVLLYLYKIRPKWAHIPEMTSPDGSSDGHYVKYKRLKESIDDNVSDILTDI